MKLRLFVALDLPDAARAALVAFRRRSPTRGVAPVPDEALHLTLAFLGHRPEADVEAVGRRCCSGRPSPRPGSRWPRAGLPLKRPRVLTAAIVDHDGTLAELQRG